MPLTQYVTDDQGTQPKESDDAPMHDITAKLDAQLHDAIPDSCSVGLFLGTPILKGRKTTNEIVTLLRGRFSDYASFDDNLDVEIHGNFFYIKTKMNILEAGKFGQLRERQP